SGPPPGGGRGGPGGGHGRGGAGGGCHDRGQPDPAPGPGAGPARGDGGWRASEGPRLARGSVPVGRPPGGPRPGGPGDQRRGRGALGTAPLPGPAPGGAGRRSGLRPRGNPLLAGGGPGGVPGSPGGVDAPLPGSRSVPALDGRGGALRDDESGPRRGRPLSGERGRPLPGRGRPRRLKIDPAETLYKDGATGGGRGWGLFAVGSGEAFGASCGGIGLGEPSWASSHGSISLRGWLRSTWSAR